MFVIKLLINAYRLISTSCPPGWLDKTKLAVQPGPSPPPNKFQLNFPTDRYIIRDIRVYIYMYVRFYFFLVTVTTGNSAVDPR